MSARGQPAPNPVAIPATIEPAEIIAVAPVRLPDSRQMALALSSPTLRNDALLDLAVAANIIRHAGQVQPQQDNPLDEALLARQFLDDRGWLARLVERYGWVKPHSAILDPAAWLVQAELQQHDLPVMALELPDHTPQPVLLYQVFQRADERLAAANLPVLLLAIEADAMTVWDTFLQLTGPDAVPEADWKPVESEWFATHQWPSPESLVETKPKHTRAVRKTRAPTAARPLQMLSQWVANVVEPGPPDPLQLVRLRFAILEQFPQLASTQRPEYRAMLYIASLVDGLQDGQYLGFTRGVLSLVANFLEGAHPSSVTSSLGAWLMTELPVISARHAADFSVVDSNLNSVLGTVNGVLHALKAPGSGSLGVKSPRAALADAVAQLSLLIPDMGYYFDTPVRARIVEEINICTSIAASRDGEGYPTMTRRQFDGCMENILQLASHEIRMAELSGDFNGPFSSDALRRESSVTPAQRINYIVGYLHHRFPSNCPPPANVLPNPLEWAVLANSMAWFAEYAKEFFTTAENESRLARMRAIGEQLIKDMAAQVNCFAASGAGINDPISRSMAAYESSLRQLNAGMVAAEADFREHRLKPGSDISFDQGTHQHTGYRPEGLLIGPCEKASVCEMSGTLSITRALIGLFPEKYLIADQSGMGRVEICYQNMGWVRRRSELVRPGDEHVANYYGHLGFDLVGRYFENGKSSDIFGFRFVSPAEYHYLFAQAVPEVLLDSCPMEWVGTRVITPLREDRGGVVPNRLTYLAAARVLPSRLLQNNWDQGSEWRDWFVTGIGVARMEMPSAPDISIHLNQHLQALYQAEQAEVYRRVLASGATDAAGDNVSLFDKISRVSIAKAMLRMQMMLFYPDVVIDSDAVHMAIAGDEGLLDFRMLRRFKADNIAPSLVARIARTRLQQFQKAWLLQPGELRRNGSIPPSLVHALTRLDSIYRQLFVSHPKPLEALDVQSPVVDRQNPQ